VFLGPYLTHIAETAAACPPAPKDDPSYQCLNPVFHVGGSSCRARFPVRRLAFGPAAGGHRRYRRHRRPSSNKKQLLALFAYIGRAPPSTGLPHRSRWLGAGLFIRPTGLRGQHRRVQLVPDSAGQTGRLDAVSSRGWATGTSAAACRCCSTRSRSSSARRGHGRDRAVEHRLGRRGGRRSPPCR
jgi:hypothetical protein